ncbi:MAG: hypothetical protein B7X00_00875, partial [Legionella sp. 21-45-4]
MFKHTTQDSFTPIDFTKSGGVSRENSFYCYAKDNLHTTLFREHRVHLGNNPEREVMYVILPNTSSEEPSTELYTSLFPGFVFVAEEGLYTRHLSIDRYSVYARHARRTDHHEYSVAHATLTFINHSEQYTIHVHYNRHGQIIQIDAKSQSGAFPLTPIQREKLIV